MKIKKLGKILGIIVTAILLFLIIMIVALNSFLKSEKCRRLITGRIETALNMPVEMGRFHTNVFSGVQIDNFNIKNPQGFPEGYSLKTDMIVLKYDLYNLLRRNFKIEEIKIVRPDINLLQKQDGTWNFPMIQGVTSSAENRMILPIADDIHIIEGNLTWTRLGKNSILSIQNFTIRIKIHSINSFPNMNLSLSIEEIGSPMASVIKDLKASMKTSEGAAYLDNMSLYFSGGSVAMKGNATMPSKDKDAEYTATISVKDIDINTLVSNFAPDAKELLKGVLDADIAIKGESFDGKADIKLTIPSLIVQDKIKIDRIKSNISYANFNFTVHALNMNVFGGSVEGKGKGSLENIKKPSFDLDLNINNIDAGTALNALGQDSMLAQGKVAGNIHATGNINDIRADGKIYSQKLNLKKIGQATDINAPFRATITEHNKEVNVDNFSAKIYGGSVGGKANITFGQDGKPRFSTTLKLSKLEAGYALKKLVGKAFITGKTEGNIKLAGRGGDINALTGSTDIIFRNGKVATHPVQNLLSVFIPSLKTINFVAAQFLSTIGNGKVNIKAATLENPKLLMYYGKGQMKLSSQKLAIPSHLSMRCNLVARIPLVSGAFTREDENWCGIDFNIFGTLSKPRSDLEDRLKRQVIGEAIEQIFGGDKKKKDKGGGIEDLLEGIFK